MPVARLHELCERVVAGIIAVPFVIETKPDMPASVKHCHSHPVRLVWLFLPVAPQAEVHCEVPVQGWLDQFLYTGNLPAGKNQLSLVQELPVKKIRWGKPSTVASGAELVSEAEQLKLQGRLLASVATSWSTNSLPQSRYHHSHVVPL